MRGEGSRVRDDEGIKHLDFVASIAADNLEHCHTRLVEAIKRQAGTLSHVSNCFDTIRRLDLADVITAHSGMTRICFCNSRAEAS
ncbi:MAG: aminotransferase class III-fold pyridoxal phosphate-dependent enzyme [Chloroflexi bacterium]|nr:aminotransferase class III-fold pyridoxal phosphate-dependent enzyme [Chloroflexota bacterium]